MNKFFITLLLSTVSQINWTKHPYNLVFVRDAYPTRDDTFVSGPAIRYDGEQYHTEKIMARMWDCACV